MAISNFGSIAASLFGGTDAPSTAISGFRDVHAGGIAVGSKVVGSGSAATSLPPVSTAPGATIDASSSAGTGVPAWFAWAGGAAVVLGLLIILLRRNK